MTIQSHGHEHELEPQYGLPERLPSSEKLLWQGSPQFRAVALQVFHLRKLAIYFAALLVWRGATVWGDGGSAIDSAMALSWPLPLALLALASVAVLAWLTARTTVYTLTDKRVVMRIGIVLTLTFNLPLRTLRAAALRSSAADGTRTGDIVLELAGPDQIAWLHLWPHVRPWHVARPQPMLRGVADAPHVAAMLVQAWTAARQTSELTQEQIGKQPGELSALPTSSTTPAAAQATPHWQPSPT